MDINCEDVEDGTCKVTYCPTEPGNYIINIKFADQHVPGSNHCSRPLDKIVCRVKDLKEGGTDVPSPC